MAMYLTAAAVMVGGNLLSQKIASNKQNDPKGAIGSGTAPSLDSGADIQITPVKGSEVQDFGDFGSQNMIEPEKMTEEQKLLAMLQEAGMGPDGLASMAFGGQVQYKGNGGEFGIDSIFDRLNIDPELMQQLLSGKTKQDYLNKIDFEAVEPMDPYSPDALQASMENQEQIAQAANIDVQPDLMVPQDATMFEQVGNYAMDNPEIFNAGIQSLSKVLSAAFMDAPEQKGSMVSTQTLPGNSARRRSTQMNIQPIGGSKVMFANEGTALKRPMFMPQGGQMRGPGGPKDDLIPVMASNGEYMLSKAAVDAAGNGSHAKGLARLDAFNKMGNKRYG
jgi:hypothetical protein